MTNDLITPAHSCEVDTPRHRDQILNALDALKLPWRCTVQTVPDIWDLGSPQQRWIITVELDRLNEFENGGSDVAD